MKTSDGKSVFKFYIRNGSLDKNTRNLMVRLIIDNEKNRQFDPIYQQGQPRRLKSFSISKEQFNTWSDEAVILFPGTSKTALYTPYRSHRVQESMPDGQIVKRVQKIKASGSFVNHLSYTQGQLKEKHLTTDPWQHIEAPVVRDANEEEQTAVDWLSHHLDPDDQVKIKWDQSFGIRQQKLKSGNYQLHEYYKDFPCLEVAIGAELLSSDFNKIYPDAADKLFDRWEIVRPVLINYLNSCKDITQADSGLVHALPTLPHHNQDAIIFYLLPYIIQAPSLRLKKGEKNNKLSIVERRAFFMIHVETAADIQPAINRQRNILSNHNLTFQPIPVLVGPINDIQSVYVYVNETVNSSIYVVNSVLHAIDLTFKLFFSLQCKFPEKADHLWNFIQKGLYEIILPIGSKCSRQTLELLGQVEHAITLSNENHQPN
ncbi:uncharacterized protein LOC122854951 isoform X2 [Aphidius gifuensis]|uniref:uncharacterized protein LOC122854951 isoform X2 n=1 Tax=Aphidius gifuensis TaxID=684658 RepID=UPI001CDC1D8B|nr:uncharacterized protein LOC122854951 isoform X2 [Aphidius gifuensis]